MEVQAALAILGAMAHETRLNVFRALVRAGPAGLPAGRIAERMELPLPTLSFHLAQLKQAGLVCRRREGRSLYYSADYGAMRSLLAFLTRNCCRGETEARSRAGSGRRGASAGV